MRKVSYCCLEGPELTCIFDFVGIEGFTGFAGTVCFTVRAGIVRFTGRADLGVLFVHNLLEKS